MSKNSLELSGAEWRQIVSKTVRPVENATARALIKDILGAAVPLRQEGTRNLREIAESSHARSPRIAAEIAKHRDALRAALVALPEPFARYVRGIVDTTPDPPPTEREIQQQTCRAEFLATLRAVPEALREALELLVPHWLFSQIDREGIPVRIAHTPFTYPPGVCERAQTILARLAPESIAEALDRAGVHTSEIRHLLNIRMPPPPRAHVRRPQSLLFGTPTGRPGRSAPAAFIPRMLPIRSRPVLRTVVQYQHQPQLAKHESVASLAPLIIRSANDIYGMGEFLHEDDADFGQAVLALDGLGHPACAGLRELIDRSAEFGRTSRIASSAELGMLARDPDCREARQFAADLEKWMRGSAAELFEGFRGTVTLRGRPGDGYAEKDGRAIEEFVSRLCVLTSCMGMGTSRNGRELPPIAEDMAFHAWYSGLDAIVIAALHERFPSLFAAPPNARTAWHDLFENEQEEWNDIRFRKVELMNKIHRRLADMLMRFQGAPVGQDVRSYMRRVSRIVLSYLVESFERLEDLILFADRYPSPEGEPERPFCPDEKFPSMRVLRHTRVLAPDDDRSVEFVHAHSYYPGSVPCIRAYMQDNVDEGPHRVRAVCGLDGRPSHCHLQALPLRDIVGGDTHAGLFAQSLVDEAIVHLRRTQSVLRSRRYSTMMQMHGERDLVQVETKVIRDEETLTDRTGFLVDPGVAEISLHPGDFTPLPDLETDVLRDHGPIMGTVGDHVYVLHEDRTPERETGPFAREMQAELRREAVRRYLRGRFGQNTAPWQEAMRFLREELRITIDQRSSHKALVAPARNGHQPKWVTLHSAPERAGTLEILALARYIEDVGMLDEAYQAFCGVNGERLADGD